VGYVWDNAEWSYMYPVRGWRANLQLSASPQLRPDWMSFQSVTYDIRRYFRLFGGTSIAARLSGGASFGQDAQAFLLGGLPWIISNEEYNPVSGSSRYKQQIFSDNDRDNLKTIYFSEYATPLRGTQMMEQVGDRAVLLNLEYRFPFLIYYFPALRVLGQLGGVLFVDAGTAWVSESKSNEIDSGVSSLGEAKPRGILTYGWGPRFILLGLPIQLDFAYQYNPPSGEKRNHWYLTIGLDY
jgi:outer membrane protein assembly factor BamA